MTDPTLMCRQHLLGEHVELHMLCGSIKRGKSLQGFIDNRLIQAGAILTRHDEIAAEMGRRGYKHQSPLTVPEGEPTEGSVDVAANLRELARRCPDCAARIEKSC